MSSGLPIPVPKTILAPTPRQFREKSYDVGIKKKENHLSFNHDKIATQCYAKAISFI